MDSERPAYLHPSLEWVCSLPPNREDYTLEHARAVFQGDVKGVLRDIARLAYTQHAHPTTTPEQPMEQTA